MRHRVPVLCGLFASILTAGLLVRLVTVSTTSAAPGSPPRPTPISAAFPGQAILDPMVLVEPARLLTTVERLEAFGNRHAFSPIAPEIGLHAASAFLLAELTTVQNANPHRRIDAYAQPFTFTYRGLTVTNTNLVLVLYGTDPAAGTVVVGAHYDTIGYDVMDAFSHQPGADDNASGTAAALEIARILAARPPLRATVIVVLFAAEETGRQGSLAFIRDVIWTQGPSIHAMLNLDGIGVPVGPDGVRRDGNMRVYSAPPADSLSRQLAWLVWDTARAYMPELSVTVHTTLDRPGRWGDHQSFSDAGIPAARLIEPADDLSRMHNGRDTSQYIDPYYLQRVTQLALAVVVTLADGIPAG